MNLLENQVKTICVQFSFAKQVFQTTLSGNIGKNLWRIQFITYSASFWAKISRFCTWYLKCPFRNQTKTGAEMCPGAPVRHIGESIGARVVFGADPVLVKICSFCSWYLKCSFRNQVKTGIIVYRSRVFVRIQSISIASCFCKGSVTWKIPIQHIFLQKIGYH